MWLYFSIGTALNHDVDERDRLVPVALGDVGWVDVFRAPVDPRRMEAKLVGRNLDHVRRCHRARVVRV